LDCLLNIAQTLTVSHICIKLTSFTKDSCQEIVLLYLLSRNMEEVYQQICMDDMFVQNLQM
jgi:hypothetical protein